MTLRDLMAWLSFPILMGGFVALTAVGLSLGYDPVSWGIFLTIANFFVIVAVEQILPRHPEMNIFRDRQSINDMGHGILLAGLARPLGGAASIFVMANLAELRGMESLGLIWPIGWWFPWQLGLGLLIHTFSDYWIHRSLHHFERLWWFHSIHHDTPQMHVLKSGRLHIGDEIFTAVLKPVLLLLIGAPPEIIVWIGLWIVFDGNLTHSNVDQRFPSWGHYFLPTVQLHNLHHAKNRAHQDSNFSGSSAIWDVIFGTFSHPDRCPLGEMGIEDSPVPVGLIGQIAFPFRAQIHPPGSIPPSDALADPDGV